MKPVPRPPRVARWILERALPTDVRTDVAGDLLEMFHRRCEKHGAAAARRWYWRQAFSFSARFGSERVREQQGRWSWSTGMSWIDLKLALRMLVRHPGLTFVSASGMAVAIAISAAAFTIARDLLDPSVPLEEGDRVVSLVTWDAATNNRELRMITDFAVWTEGLTSVQELSAFRTVGRNLIAPGAQPETVSVAEMSPSGFPVARVSPAIGRYLLPEDQRRGAADVAGRGCRWGECGPC